jgi:hypothetical protein
MNEAEFDALLRDGLAPPVAPPDRAFVAKVDMAVAEAEHRRFWRARLVPQLATEGAALAAVVASLALVARAPAVRATLAQAPGLAWPMLLSLLLFWILIRGHRDFLGDVGGSALSPTGKPWRFPNG